MNLITTGLAVHEWGHARYSIEVQKIGVFIGCKRRKHVNGVDHYCVAPADDYLEDLDDTACRTLAGPVGEMLLIGAPISWESVRKGSRYGVTDFEYIDKMIKHKWIKKSQLDDLCIQTADVIRPSIREDVVQIFRLMLSQMEPNEMLEIEYETKTGAS